MRVNLRGRPRLKGRTILAVSGDRGGRACLSETAGRSCTLLGQELARSKSIGPIGAVVADDPAVSERRALPYAGPEAATLS
jgi:hypothetical protein